MKMATVYIEFKGSQSGSNFTEEYDFPTLKMAEDFMQEVKTTGNKAVMIVYSEESNVVKVIFSVLAFCMLVGCGDITQFEAQFKKQPVAAVTPTITPTATPTPNSQVVIDGHTSVSQYGQSEPVTVTTTVTVGAQATATPAPKEEEHKICDAGPHGKAVKFFVLDRLTNGWPWTVNYTTKIEEEANERAENLVNKGFFPWNVDVEKQYEDGCFSEPK